MANTYESTSKSVQKGSKKVKNADSDTKKPEKGLTVEKANNLLSDFKKATEDAGWTSLAEESWRRFQQQDPDSRRSTKQKRFPLWYATGKVRQPLVFSKVPETVVQPILPDKAGFLTEVALFTEKFAEVLLEQFPFFNVACGARDDLLLTNVGVARVMVDAEFVLEPGKEYLETDTIEVEGPQGPVPQEIFIDKEGNQVDPATVRYDHEGGAYIELPEVQERAQKEKVFLKHVCFKDFVWDHEAKEFSEWDYCAFKSKLTKRQIVDRFGKDALEKLPKADQQRNSRLALRHLAKDRDSRSITLPDPSTEM